MTQKGSSIRDAPSLTANDKFDTRAKQPLTHGLLCESCGADTGRFNPLYPPHHLPPATLLQ